MPQSKTSPQQKSQEQKPAKIWLSSPHMGGTELDYVHDAFEKNWIAPLGSNVNGLEEDLGRYTGPATPRC
ncbi:MAG: hypothetical protein WD037_11405 [Balneolales bacterium]